MIKFIKKKDPAKPLVKIPLFRGFLKNPVRAGLTLMVSWQNFVAWLCPSECYL
ncbi:hypothetical protein NIASO_02345 [Niabella soli DSM 19437]|uniref:Uncharacterized protein n=1 Tax=Niabella soli DSM 19437 TaxID=929713 RepID=W0F6Q1_9BACT|nr:hypothetical protein NIASO_02345 [Niabella soli DSM 19437]